MQAEVETLRIEGGVLGELYSRVASDGGRARAGDPRHRRPRLHGTSSRSSRALGFAARAPEHPDVSVPRAIIGK